MKDCTISSNGNKSLHEFSYAALGTVVTAVSLINSLCGAVHKLSTKRSSIPLWKSPWYDIIVLLSNKNGTYVVKLAKDFNIPTRVARYRS